MITLIKRYPLITYFILAYALFWLIWIPITPFLQNLATLDVPIWAIPLALIGIYAPTWAALIVTFICEGKTGLKTLLRPLTEWRIHLGWYAVAIFLPLLLGLIAILLHTIFTTDTLTLQGKQSAIFLLLATIPITLLNKLPLGPMAEELGWRGFALPRLQRKYTALTASLILGVLWAFWHLPAFWVPGAALPLDTEPGIIPIGAYVLDTVGVTIIFTWLYNHTRGSLIIDFLFHAAYNALPTLLFVTLDLIPEIWFSITVWATVFFLIWRYGADKLGTTKVTKQ
ncbi:MAG TPA: CPBP family intramembrane glutamic endopeptidase [Anaerolineae bacterium]|nr:CPBP family intramembrane glutamic endopeptidase [Anaerolineae bacterium]